jgi:transcriptional repressor NrdR
MKGELDTVAYVRFASVYRSFQDVGEFMREVQELSRERRRGARARGGRPPSNG